MRSGVFLAQIPNGVCMPAFMVKLRERREEREWDVHVRACDAMEIGKNFVVEAVGRRAAAFGS